MEYGIIAERTIRDLEQTVNRLIQEGWLLCGGISAVPINHSYLRRGAYHDIKVEYLQAMWRQRRSGTMTT